MSIAWLKVISSQSNDPHLSYLSGNLKQMQTIIINIIRYLQLICQGFTETFDSKLNSEGDEIRHKQKKKQKVNSINAKTLWMLPLGKEFYLQF